jgi:hypothetical protein
LKLCCDWRRHKEPIRFLSRSARSSVTILTELSLLFSGGSENRHIKIKVSTSEKSRSVMCCIGSYVSAGSSGPIFRTKSSSYLPYQGIVTLSRDTKCCEKLRSTIKSTLQRNSLNCRAPYYWYRCVDLKSDKGDANSGILEQKRSFFANRDEARVSDNEVKVTWMYCCKTSCGTHGSVVVKALCYTSGGRGFESR